jgi:alkylhydroperoxidase family enzyme
VRDPSALDLPPRERALAGLASLITEAPWTVDDDDLDRVRAAGVSDEGVVQAVTVAAMFNHLTRVADATGVEPDYASPLPRIEVDASRAPLPRPDPAEIRPRTPRLSLSLRPRTEEAIARWRAHAQTPSAALGAEERAVIGRAAAHFTGDAAGAASWGDARPETAREAALAGFAERLTVAPWRVTDGDLEALRREGLEDRGLLDVIALVGFQNMDSRVRLALG